jgi:hypothetical protein
MSELGVEKEILDEVHKLRTTQQRKVLAFARSLTSAELRGVSGKSLLQFVGAIDKEDLLEMAQAIHEDCERVEPNEW